MQIRIVNVKAVRAVSGGKTLSAKSYGTMG
jgi:hypothetical protein